MEIETLDARYIDSAALLALLKQLFGVGLFTIDVSISPKPQRLGALLIREALACRRYLHLADSTEAYKGLFPNIGQAMA